MKIGYARVSSHGQNLDVQLEALQAYGCDKIYSEKKSGTKRDNRIELGKAMDNLREGDVLVVTRIDRLARSVLDLNNIAKEIQDKGADLTIIEQSLDTTQPHGKLTFDILGAISEFETALRRERQKEGIDSAKKKGVKFGRERTITDEQIQEIKDRIANREKVTHIAKLYGISRTHVYKLIKDSEDN